MMKIEDFIKNVTDSRRRTGIALLNPESNLLKDFDRSGIRIVDITLDFSGSVIISDDVLSTLISEKAVGMSTCYINIELYVGPRFEESYYLKSLLPKLICKEPLRPIFIVFYSKIVYEKFKSYYMGDPHTSNHCFEEDF